MGDDSRSGRSTRRFDSEQLAKLTRHAGIDSEAEREWGEGRVAAGSQSDALPSSSRTSTVHDPLTMALLAEVARTSNTVEVDPAMIEEAKASTEADTVVEPSAHPRIKRR